MAKQKINRYVETTEFPGRRLPMSESYSFDKTLLKIQGKEVPCLLFECGKDKLLKQACTDLGYTVFEIRHGDNNWADPKTIEQKVLINFWGYVALTDEKVLGLLTKKLEKDGFFQVSRRSLNRFDEDTSRCYTNCPIPTPASLA